MIVKFPPLPMPRSSRDPALSCRWFGSSRRESVRGRRGSDRRGSMIDQVTCTADPSQSYAVLVSRAITRQPAFSMICAFECGRARACRGAVSRCRGADGLVRGIGQRLAQRMTKIQKSLRR